jgi:hypothetical protein
VIKTEYEIGQTVNLPWKVAIITVTEDGTRYMLTNDATERTLSLEETQIMDMECVSADDYEAEINDLKDEISRLREMYQLEHLKALKLKNEPCRGMDSHHPTPNTYADDWRMP